MNDVNDDAALFLALSGQQKFAGGGGTSNKKSNDDSSGINSSSNAVMNMGMDHASGGGGGSGDVSGKSPPTKNVAARRTLPTKKSSPKKGKPSQAKQKKRKGPSALEMESVYGLQKIGQPVPPFRIGKVRRKSPSGASLCLAEGCEKNSQANTKINSFTGFCKVHYNLWLISTGQIESWECFCKNRVPVGKRCGKCHRWQDPGMAKKSAAAKKRVAKEDDVCGIHPITQVPLGSNVKISSERRTNEKGRPLCRVVGCEKLDQSKNDGFCRLHFNMFSITDMADSDWLCTCGETMPGKQKRCGKCNRWKGGKRAPFAMKSKLKSDVSPLKTSPSKRKTNASKSKKKDKHAPKKGGGGGVKHSLMSPQHPQIPSLPPMNSEWDCKCGNSIPANKARCGLCHSWKGGKRKGGWKIKGCSDDIPDDGIEWDKDWLCCGALIPARKKRCGQCHKWRGGKRVASVKDAPMTSLLALEKKKKKRKPKATKKSEAKLASNIATDQTPASTQTALNNHDDFTSAFQEYGATNNDNLANAMRNYNNGFGSNASNYDTSTGNPYANFGQNSVNSGVGNMNIYGASSDQQAGPPGGYGSNDQSMSFGGYPGTGSGNVQHELNMLRATVAPSGGSTSAYSEYDLNTLRAAAGAAGFGNRSDMTLNSFLGGGYGGNLGSRNLGGGLVNSNGGGYNTNDMNVGRGNNSNDRNSMGGIGDPFDHRPFL